MGDYRHLPGNRKNSQGKEVGMILLFQFPMSPKEYSESWGIIGILAFVIVVLLLIIYTVFVRGNQEMQKRTDTFLGFVQQHTDKHIGALEDLGDKIKTGEEKLADAVNRNTRITRGLVIAIEGIYRARLLKGNNALTHDDIDRIVRESTAAVDRGNG
jgi:hypothetical protein